MIPMSTTVGWDFTHGDENYKVLLTLAGSVVHSLRLERIGPPLQETGQKGSISLRTTTRQVDQLFLQLLNNLEYRPS